VIRRANATTTTCADGVKKPECIVTGLDLSAIKFPGTEERSLKLFVIGQADNESVALMVRGRMTGTEFRATEVWRQDADLTGAPNHGLDGVAVKLKDNGIRCITSPCPSTAEDKLNSVKSQTVHAVSAATSELSGAILRAVFSDNPVIVIGTLSQRTVQLTNGQTKTSRVRNAAAVFFRVGQ
jgi:hypothetical protein